MTTSFAAGTLIVLGTLLTVVGLFVGGNLVLMGLGLAAIAVGGMLGLLDRRVSA